MIQLADLFHEHRLGEISFLFILYLPIGLVLLLLRSIALALLYLLSFVLPKNSPLINDALAGILTCLFTDETAADARENPANIVVANRLSIFDSVALRRYFARNDCLTIDLWKNDVAPGWFKLESMLSAGTQEDLLDSCATEVQRSNVRLIFQPECTMTSGTDGLLNFNLFPFTLAQKQQLTILPVCLRISRPLTIRSSTFNSHPVVDLFWFLFSPFTRFHLQCLPLLTSTESSTDETMCETARQVISRTLKVEPTLYDEGDVRELQRQPDLFYRRQAQRREQFQQMVNLVHQQVPQASIEAIRYDLETTKNVDQTIANLKERAAAAIRAANKATSNASSSAMNKSSTGNNHRANYERLKQELIEKNRQLFLNKNST